MLKIWPCSSSQKCIFLQVVEPPLQFVNPSFYETTIQTDVIHEYLVDFKRKKEEISAYLAGIQEGFQKKGIDTGIFVEQGGAVETILSVAQRENADLIAIASHGRSGLSRVFYGSVAAGIMQKIDISLKYRESLEQQAEDIVARGKTFAFKATARTRDIQVHDDRWYGRIFPGEKFGARRIVYGRLVGLRAVGRDDLPIVARRP